MSSYALATQPAVYRLIELALEEDLGRGDVTSDAIFGDEEADAEALFVAREPMVVYGLGIVAAVFAAVDDDVEIVELHDDGDKLETGDNIMSVNGSVRSILAAERTALNFLQRLSGVATLSRQFEEAVRGTSTRVVDTRKTTPGYRLLEKAAVVAGGCGNHRADLASGILIKDNHIAAAGSVHEAVIRAIANAPHPLRIEVEVEDMDGVMEALDAGAEILLLDNMDYDAVRAAAKVAHDRGVRVEVSGGVTLETVRLYAEAGADFISVGALTHSAPAMDIALDFAADDDELAR